MMNDPQFVEAARHLAENAIKRGEDDRSRAEWMFRTVLCRPAHEIDVTEMAAAAGEFRTIFQQNNDTAQQLIHTGESTPDPQLDSAELAAWTMVANTLMNRDDFINN